MKRCSRDCILVVFIYLQIHILPQVKMPARGTTLCDLRYVCGFLCALRFPPPMKPTTIDIASILLNLDLHTTNST